MSQQQQGGGFPGRRAIGGRLTLVGTGQGTTTVINPAPGATTDVLVNNPNPNATTTLNVSGRPGRVPPGTGSGTIILQTQLTGLQPGQRNSLGRFQPNIPRTSLALQSPQYYNQFQDFTQQQQQQPMQYVNPGQTYYPSSGQDYLNGVSFPPMQIVSPTNSRGMISPGAYNAYTGQGDIYGRGAYVQPQRGSSSGSISSRRRYDDDEYMRQIMLGLKAATGMPYGNYSGSGSGNVRSPFGFDILYNTQNIFIQPTEGDFADLFSTNNLVGKYDILDTNGDRLYIAADVLGKSGNSCCGGNGNFSISIMSCDGTEVLNVSGDSTTFIMKSMMASPSFDTKGIVGYVVEDQNCCSMVTNYGIKDRTGSICFRILREPSNPNPTEYEVFGNDMMKIGRMSKIWAGLPRRGQKLANTYGISFPQDMEVREKAMMMGAAVGVYMKYYGDRKRDQRIARHAWFCAVLVVLLFAFIIVGIIFVIIHTTL